MGFLTSTTWRSGANLRRFAASGVKAVYHGCDLSDCEALARLLNEIRSADGPIRGIIHGAGYGEPDRFEFKKRRKIDRTIEGKVLGAMNLMTLTRPDPLESFVAFGSLSGRFGGNGLSDYAAANDMLAKLVDWYRRQRPDCPATCLHWQTWANVGMSTKADDVGMVKNELKMEFISPAGRLRAPAPGTASRPARGRSFDYRRLLSAGLLS